MRLPPGKKYPLSVRLLLYFQKKRYGAPLSPTLIWGLRPKLLFAFLKFGRAFEKRSALSKHLRLAVMLKISELSNCPFCVDLNKWQLEQEKKPSTEEERSRDLVGSVTCVLPLHDTVE